MFVHISVFFVTKLSKPSKSFCDYGKHANRLLPSGDTVVEPLQQSFVSFVGFVSLRFDVFFQSFSVFRHLQTVDNFIQIAIHDGGKVVYG